MKNESLSNSIDSNVIANIRFPLMIMIVTIHSFINGVDKNTYPLFWYSQHILSEVIGYVAVYAFFFISGYLMFLGVEKYDIQLYKSKLYRRIKNLVIPYLLWNIIYLIIAIGYTYHKERVLLFQDWNLVDWLKPFYCYGDNSRFPIAGPLWFVRDLFMIFLLSPFIFISIKRLGIIMPIFCMVLSFSDVIPNVIHVRFSSLAYVVWGGYFSINKVSVSSLCVKYNKMLLLIYLIVIPVSIWSESTAYAHIVDNISKFIGVFTLFSVFSLITVKSRNMWSKCITDASFYLYAMHLLLIIYCREFILTNFKVVSNNNVSLYSIYFSTIVVCIVICTLTYHISRKISPRFTTLLTGSR